MCAMAKLKCLRFARTSGGWLNEQCKVLVIALVGAVVTSVIFFVSVRLLMMCFSFFPVVFNFLHSVGSFFFTFIRAQRICFCINWYFDERMLHLIENEKKNRDDGKNNANHRKISCIWMCAQICACRVCLYAWICYDVHCPKCMRIAVAVATVSVRIEFIGSCHEKIK